MIPTVGRIVHYTGAAQHGAFPQTYAALITAAELANQFYEGQPPATSEENKYKVSLHVFYPAGQQDMPSVPWSEKAALGHWNWPPFLVVSHT